MRVITINVNGIRAAAKKGLFGWLARQRADVICIQETKAQEHQLGGSEFRLNGYTGYFFDAEKKGYSGVALYCRQEPMRIKSGIGWAEADREGRYLQADFGDVSVASLYLPSGSSGEHRQDAKYRFMEAFYPFLKKLRGGRHEVILCGDWNIAHKEIDLKNWRSNQKNSGFLPDERAWLTRVFDEQGWVDVFRRINDRPDQYTWWSNRGQAWAKNVGWRIDYQVATPGIAATAFRERIYKEARFSDHAPLIIDYRCDL